MNSIENSEILLFAKEQNLRFLRFPNPSGIDLIELSEKLTLSNFEHKAIDFGIFSN